jgi:hypothetical protein
MISKTKIALIAAIAAVGIATPALADGFPVIPQYSLPSEAPGFGVAPRAVTGPRSHQTVVRSRALYDSATVPSNDSSSYGNQSYSNWANDAEWSTTGRQNSGH